MDTDINSERQKESERFKRIEDLLVEQMKFQPINRLDNIDDMIFLVRLIYRYQSELEQLRSSIIVPDDAIDTSDIPEAEEEWFKKARLTRPQK